MQPEAQSMTEPLSAGQTVPRRGTDTNEGRRPVSGCLCSALVVCCEVEEEQPPNLFVLSCVRCHATYVRE